MSCRSICLAALLASACSVGAFGSNPGDEDSDPGKGDGFGEGESTPHTFEARANAFYLDGTPVILRGGTVQWFRLPEGVWEDRLRRFRAAGFNTVDMYVAWNSHEREEGVFDFETPDLRKFLRLCAEQGLFVYFRPGPYITNELDGGGLPAYLFPRTTKKNREADGRPNLRTNDPDYLAEVERYFAALNEVVRPYLVTHGGPIILYAIENEYDWFETFHEVDKLFWYDGGPERGPAQTPDTRGYLAALRDMARAQGIDVPLTTCPGDAKVAGMGDVEGVIPMPNIYKQGDTEAIAYDIVTWMHDPQQFGGAYTQFPSGSTETDRTATRFKRLVMGGMDACFAFNVVGMRQDGFRNAVVVDNAGPSSIFDLSIDNILNAFVSPTVGYFHNVIDYYGAVGPSGTLRTKFSAFRRTNLFFDAFQDRIGEVLHPQHDDPRVRLDHPNLSADYWLDAGGGNYFIGVVNESGAPQVVPAGALHVDGLDLPRHSELTVPVAEYPGALSDGGTDLEYSMILVTGLPLTESLRLRYTTAEILTLRDLDGERLLMLYGVAGTEGELALDGDYTVLDTDPGIRTHSDGTLSFGYGSPASLLLRDDSGRELRVLVTTRHLAGRIWFGPHFAVAGPDYVAAIDGDQVQFEHSQPTLTGFFLDAAGVHPFTRDLEPSFPELPNALATGTLYRNQLGDDGWFEWQGNPLPLEELGIFGGQAWYRVTVHVDGEPSAPTFGRNFWIDHASNFVGIYVNGTYITTLAPLGTEIDNRSWAPSYGFPDLTPYLVEGDNTIDLRTEVWGHGSFMWPRGTLIGAKASLPSVGFDSLEGLWGEAWLNDTPLTQWRVKRGAGTPAPSGQATAMPLELERGAVVWYETRFRKQDLPDPQRFHAPAVISLRGHDAKATLYLNGRLIGRWLSDEEWLSRGSWARARRDMWMNTPPDDFPILPETLQDENTLLILFEDTSGHDEPGGRIDELSLRYNRELRSITDGHTVEAPGIAHRGVLEATW